MAQRVLPTFGGVIMLGGAIAIGWVLNRTVVAGSLPYTDPAAVLGIGVGFALVVVGFALHREFDPSDYVRSPEDNLPEPPDSEFDEEHSPISEADLAKYERDEPPE